MDVQGDGACLDSNKVSAAGDDGCVVGCTTAAPGPTTAPRAAHMDGFGLVGAGNTLTFNKAQGSHDGFDLNDLAGNTNGVDESNKFRD